MADQGEASAVSRRRVLAVVALWTVVMGAASFASGCYGHNCDGDIQVYGRTPGEGQLLDANTWQSGPVDGDWLPFPKQRLWIFELRDLGDREPEIVIPYVTADPNPLQTAGNFTIGAGNLAEISGAEKGRVAIHNGTCADYYLRLVVQTSARPPGGTVQDASSPVPDAGSDAEAGP